MMDNYTKYGLLAAGAVGLYLIAKGQGLSDNVPLSKIPYKELSYVEVDALEWRDKINGNSYWSSRVYFGTKDGQSYVFYMPYQYGYGRTAEYDSINKLGTQYVDFGKRGKNSSSEEKWIDSWEDQLDEHLDTKYKYTKSSATKKQVQNHGKSDG